MKSRSLIHLITLCLILFLAATVTAQQQFPQPVDPALQRIEKVIREAWQEANQHVKAGGKEGDAYPGRKWAATLWQYRQQRPGTAASAQATAEALRFLVHAGQVGELIGKADSHAHDDAAWKRSIGVLREAAERNKDYDYLIAKPKFLLEKSPDREVRMRAQLAFVHGLWRKGEVEAARTAFQKVVAEPADLVLKNANIYTVDAARRWAQALAVRDGRLVYVGTDDGVRGLIGPRTRLIDLNGRLVLPGFHDSHAHPIAAGLQGAQCDLTKAHSIEEALARVKTYAEANPQKSWILGFGWNPSLFPEGKLHKRLLDSVVSNRPVLLTAAGGGQSIWVNSRALAISGVTGATPEPKNGRIERDQATGEPTGVFRGAARGLISGHIPAPTPQEYREALRYALKEFARLGIVSFEDAYAMPASLDTYIAAQREGALTARVRAALPFQAELDPSKDDEQVRRLLEARRTYQSPSLRADVVKLHVDGMIDIRTAALLDPYQPLGKQREGPGFAGLPRYDADRLHQLAMRLDREGFQTHLHAVGDRAVRMALDALAQARLANGVRDSRHIITHLHLVHPQDARRFQQLGVVANFQPVMASANDYNSKLVEPLVGHQRSQRLYPIRSIMDSGAIVTAGGDWPDSSLNPLEGIQVAVTRQAVDAANHSAWVPEQRVDLTRMIAAYTIAGAYQSFMDRDSGSLEVGKRADFIVLDRNLFTIPVQEIHRAKVLWTVFEGQEVFSAEDWKSAAQAPR